MKRLLITTLTFALATPAFADNINQSGVGNNVQAQSGNANTQIIGNGNNSPGSNSPHATATGGTAIAGGGSARSDSHSASSSASFSSQKQAQGQSQSADNAGNAQSVTFAQKRYPANSANAASIYPAEGCMGAASMALSTGPVAFGAGKSYEGENCIMWRDSANLKALGLRNAALKRICMDETIASSMEAEDDNPCLKVMGKSSHLKPSLGAGKTGSRDSASLKPHGDVRAIDRN